MSFDKSTLVLLGEALDRLDDGFGKLPASVVVSMAEPP